jgi:hypothetical protein
MTFKTELEQRVEDIAKAVEASAGQHNGLVGRLNEAKFILEQMAASELKALAEKAIDAVLPDAATPAAPAAAPTPASA